MQRPEGQRLERLGPVGVLVAGVARGGPLLGHDETVGPRIEVQGGGHLVADRDGTNGPVALEVFGYPGQELAPFGLGKFQALKALGGGDVVVAQAVAGGGVVVAHMAIVTYRCDPPPEEQGMDHGHQRENDHHGGHDRHAGHSPEMFRDRFWLSLALTAPVLYFSEQFQAWFGYSAVTFPLSSWINPVLGTALFFYGGWPFLRGAVRELRARQPAMMMLISLAISVAYLYSMAVVLGLLGKPFFWELATLIVIMLLGHWMEMASVQSAGKALEHLASLVPQEAHRLVGDRIEDIPVGELRHGDSILIRPGEQVPVDGDVTVGRSSVNEAFLTGESRPVSKAAGDEVVAGAVNGEGALTVEVTRTGEQTTLSQIQRLVAEAETSRSRFQNLGDRAAGWLFYLAVGAGALTLVVWLFAADDVQFAIARTVTVLVIACPHALGFAIPLVAVNATAMSARNGILVRNREGFERARNLETIAFDKTGTLTEGTFEVHNITTDGITEFEALRLAGALEQRSEHPLAAAIVTAADRKKVSPAGVDDFEVIAGQGVTGSIDGQSLWLGRAEWLAEQGITLTDDLAQGLEQAESRGESVIVLFDESQGLAVFALADKVRESARQTVAQLKRLGVQTVMITGDAGAVAATVARDLGVDRYYAGPCLRTRPASFRRSSSLDRRRLWGTASTTRPHFWKPVWALRSAPAPTSLSNRRISFLSTAIRSTCWWPSSSPEPPTAR